MLTLKFYARMASKWGKEKQNCIITHCLKEKMRVGERKTWSEAFSLR